MLLLQGKLKKEARYYHLTVSGVGLGVLAYAVFATLRAASFDWLYLAPVAMLSGSLRVSLPAFRDRIRPLSVTVSDSFVFLAVLLFSPEVAVVIASFDMLSAGLRSRADSNIHGMLFNCGQAAISTLLAGRLFYALQDPRRLSGAEGGGAALVLFLLFGLCALVHYALNSGMVVLASRLGSGRNREWPLKENLLWASVTSLVGAALAVIIFLNLSSSPLLAAALSLPIVGAVYCLYRLNLRRVEQADERFQELEDLYHATITSLAMAIDAKDQETHGNVQKVKIVALGLAVRVGIEDEKVLEGLRTAALLHDVGKLAVPEYILNKPGRLTEAEAARVRSHPTIGADILETVPFPYPVAPFVRYHHERWDGLGYPEGLKAEEIPLAARILSLVDCYFGLRSDRPFRPKLSRELALNLIRHESGAAFDPGIVQLFLEHVDELEGAADKADQHTHYPRIRESVISMTPGEVAEPIRGTVFHDIASTYKEMQAVYEITQTIGRSLSISETLSHLSSRIKRFVPYSSCVIYLVNSEDNRVLPHHAAGMYKGILEGVEIRLGEGVTGWVAANNKPLIDVSPEPDFPNLDTLRTVFKSCLAVPLSVGETIVGVITLYSSSLKVYSDEHLGLMEAIAPHSAAAISNAVVYEETQEDAYTDALTGLPNIRYFNAYVDEELKRAKRLGYPVTFFMMDLERFKWVNDRYGHKTGDLLLQEVGKLLRGQLRKSDICLRYGGDEFLALLPGVDKRLARQTKRRIQSALDEHPLMQVEGEEIKVGISVGLATFPGDGIETDLLIAEADREMYRDKVERTQSSDRSRVVPFERRSDEG